MLQFSLNNWSLRDRLTAGVLILSAFGFIGAGIGSQALLHDYLINRGAIPWTGWTSVFTATKFDPVHFPGCKAFHHSNGYTRLFMPDEDEALLFVLAFGHLIRSTHIRAINNLLKETHE